MSRESLALAALLVAVSACGSSAPSTFYALAPANGAAQPARPLVIRLRRPGVAAYLDRPEIVRRVADFRLGLTDTDRWAAPLDEMLGRVLAEDIEQRLPGSVVFTQDGAITADADATVEVDVRRFDVGAAGDASLTAEVAMENGRTHTPAGTRAVSLRKRPPAATTAALVSTMSDLLGQLADQIATLVREGGARGDPGERHGGEAPDVGKPVVGLH